MPNVVNVVVEYTYKGKIVCAQSAGCLTPEANCQYAASCCGHGADTRMCITVC